MIIPLRDKNIFKIFKCGICHKNYVTIGENNISCAVMHSPGACCHYSDKELTEDQIKQIENIILYKE